MTDTDQLQHLTEELERARSDYLAVSRNARLYSSAADHAEAEDRAWQRLEEALAAMAAVEEAGDPS